MIQLSSWPYNRERPVQLLTTSAPLAYNFLEEAVLLSLVLNQLIVKKKSPIHS
jgi:hypothetical protein